MNLLLALLLAATPTLPPHPRLLLDAADVTALRQRNARAAWAARWAAWQHEVEATLAEPVALPPRGGNWSHNYVCPVHGARLKRGQQLGPWQWEHVCPVGPHVLHGDPSKAMLDFDGNAIAGVHGTWSQRAADAGVLWQVSGDRKYADRAKAIVLAYAERYRTYAMHDNQGRPRLGGRVASQSLTEASWLIPLTQGADLVWETLSVDERTQVEQGVLRAALDDVILKSHLGVHNIQCRLNAAIGLVGLLLGDAKLIGRAIDDPATGFRTQIAKGVQDDGMWTEGSSGYHYFTIGGLLPLAEAARHCGIDLYSDRFKTMFDAPLVLAMPDFALPDFNDSGTVALKGEADSYEIALARWHDARYVPLLQASPRTGRNAVFAGVAELPAAPATGQVAGSRNSPASGYGILQAGTGEDATWLCAKYGHHGGGHGHNDKNHFVLYSRGAVVMPDGGTHAYGSPLHGQWDKCSLAHNTLTVDETSQAQATGRSLGFGSVGGVDWQMTDAGPIVPGLRFVRTTALLDHDLVLVADRIQADKPHTLDLASHFRGVWQALPAGTPWTAPRQPGYELLAGATSRDASGGLSLTVRGKPVSPRVTLAADGPTEAITGTGVGASTEDRVPMVLWRRQAAETWFVWAVSLDGKAVELKAAPAGEACGIELRRGKDAWHAGVDVKGATLLMRR